MIEQAIADLLLACVVGLLILVVAITVLGAAFLTRD